jgi:hypothetical protein
VLLLHWGTSFAQQPPSAFFKVDGGFIAIQNEQGQVCNPINQLSSFDSGDGTIADSFVSPTSKCSISGTIGASSMTAVADCAIGTIPSSCLSASIEGDINIKIYVRGEPGTKYFVESEDTIAASGTGSCATGVILTAVANPGTVNTDPPTLPFPVNISTDSFTFTEQRTANPSFQGTTLDETISYQGAIYSRVALIYYLGLSSVRLKLQEEVAVLIYRSTHK